MNYEAVLSKAPSRPAYTDSRWNEAGCDGVLDVPGMDGRACLSERNGTVSFHVVPSVYRDTAMHTHSTRALSTRLDLSCKIG